MRASIEIARPIVDVFAVLTDVTKTGRWFPADVEEHWTSPAPYGVGSTRRATVKVLGRGVSNDAVVTAYDPPRHAALRVQSRAFPLEVALHFSRIGEGTRVDVDMSLDAAGPMKLLASPVMRWYGRGWQRGLERFKDVMESGQL